MAQRMKNQLLPRVGYVVIEAQVVYCLVELLSEGSRGTKSL